MRAEGAPSIAFRDAFRVWARIGWLSFGGPAGQIALMHHVLVEDKEWLAEREYLAALNFCMLLPGPEAMQLASYAGWRLHGWRGGLTAGALFVLPGALVILGLSALYAAYGQLNTVAALFLGIKAAVLAIVVQALVRIARRALRQPFEWALAAGAFLSLYFLAAPFPLVIAAAAVLGFLHSRSANEAVAAPGAPLAASHTDSPDWATSVRTAALWLVLWWAPVAILVATFGAHHVFSDIALFFSKLAVVTFGGAYAVLSYMAQQAVEAHGWLSAGEMLDGLGLAETTPGPLILVTQFVGFVAGYRAAGGMAGGLAGAVITLWVTFVPCFLWILTCAPYVDRLSRSTRLSGALNAITSAVVGVIFNLSLWFALHVSFATVERAHFWHLQPWLPRFETIDVAAVLLTVVAAILVFGLRYGVVTTLAICSALGLIYRLL